LQGKLSGMTQRIRDAFHLQARYCREAGSALTAEVVAALGDMLDHGTRTGARILDWPGDPIADALPLRIAGGLHALARSGREELLTRYYTTHDLEAHPILRQALAKWDDWLSPWLDGPPQTNEVARAGALWPGMLEIARRFGPDMEWIEIGSSAGLNLNMDRFGYQLGPTRTGDRLSAVQLSPAWTGPSPQAVPVHVHDRVGIDLNPLDVSDPVIAERMMAYIWPDQPQRLARADAAIRVAQANPPPLVKGDACLLLAPLLAEPQAEGRTRVIFHSIVLQYFPPDARAQVKDMIEAAGARSDAARPLAWLSMEFPAQVTEARLTLRSWPGDGAETVLATVHPHGASVNWVA